MLHSSKYQMCICKKSSGSKHKIEKNRCSTSIPTMLTVKFPWKSAHDWEWTTRSNKKNLDNVSRRLIGRRLDVGVGFVTLGKGYTPIDSQLTGK